MLRVHTSRVPVFVDLFAILLGRFEYLRIPVCQCSWVSFA